MKHREKYNQLARVVEDRAIDKRTATIIKDFGRYFELFPECDLIPLKGEFHSWFTTVAHKKLSADDAEVYRKTFVKIAKEPDGEEAKHIASALVEAACVVELADIVERYESEREIAVLPALRSLVDRFGNELSQATGASFVDTDGELFADPNTAAAGLRWRWECLNNCMRPLAPGDFGIIAARPNQGKTTAVSDNVTCFAEQLGAGVDAFGDRKVVLWLNNEGPGKRIQQRLVQSALGATTSELLALQQKGRMWKDYAAAVGGSVKNILVQDIHGWTSAKVEDLIKTVRPAVVVFDMLDKIKFAGLTRNNGERTDQLLEAMYDWGRDTCAILGCVGLATSQLHAEAEGKPYPAQWMLAESKTGKQGASDFIVTIGCANTRTFTRFINTTKNKLELEGIDPQPRCKMLLDPDTARYITASEEAATADDEEEDDGN